LEPVKNEDFHQQQHLMHLMQYKQEKKALRTRKRQHFRVSFHFYKALFPLDTIQMYSYIKASRKKGLGQEGFLFSPY